MVLSFEERLDRGVRIDGRRVMLHQPARVGRRPVVAVEIAAEHPQHRHLLASVVRRVRQPSREDPGSRSPHIEERGQLLPPPLIALPEALEAAFAVFRVSRHELESRLLRRQRRRAHVDAEHRPEPRILADALMHHVLANAAPARVIPVRPDSEIVVSELAPDAEYLDAFGGVAVDQEVVFHRRTAEDGLGPSPI